MALASINPVKGINKPIITKLIPSDNTIDNTLYAFSPDIISDKYLVIDEGKLKVINYNDIKEYYIENQYEFVGDIRNFKKIYDAYRENKTVDNTFFYTALTNKPLLSEDQIDFDDNFKRTNFEYIRLAILSELASIKYNHSLGILSETSIEVPIKTQAETKLYRKYNEFGLHTRYSIDGYYVESTLLDRRSAFVNKHNDVDENLIMSVLNRYGG